MCFVPFPPSLVTWASNNKYRMYKAFKTWSESTLFFPLSGINDVVVEAVIKEGATLTYPEGCTDCAEHFTRSDILNSISAVNWNGITSFNLKSIVSCGV